jgi:hypothetical protein
MRSSRFFKMLLLSEDREAIGCRLPGGLACLPTVREDRIIYPCLGRRQD